MDTQPMTPGGAWMSISSDSAPQYIVNPDHIRRLLAEGWQMATDPRAVATEVDTAIEPGQETTGNDSAEVEELKAKLAALEATAPTKTKRGSKE